MRARVRNARVAPSAAFAVVLGLIVAGCSATHSTAPTSSSTTTTTIGVTTTAADNAVVAAQQVADCIRLHGMRYASQKSVDPSGVQSPFLQSNPTPYQSTDPIYSGGSPTVTEFETCAWPPSPWADQTGYAQFIVTTVPGALAWPGETTPGAYADVIDGASCPDFAAVYTGGHTGSSFSRAVRVATGGLKLTNASPLLRPNGVALSSFAAWAHQLGYFVQPGEAAILFAGDESIRSLACVTNQ